MSLLATLQLACLLAFAALLLAAAWQDLRTMRIADFHSLTVVAVYGVWAVAGILADTLALSAVAFAAGCAVAVFALGAFAFAAGALGGGDVKLLAASSLFAGPALVIDFLAITALAGGVLGVAVLVGARIGRAAAPAGQASVRTRLRGGVPYGPAIAAGGIWLAATLAAS